jgi:hypothetical protein
MDKHFCNRHARHGGELAEKYLRVVSIKHFPFCYILMSKRKQK